MQIRFSYETKYGKFSDALNLPDDHSFTTDEITAMQEQRRDNWVAYIDSTQLNTVDEVPTETPIEETTQDNSNIVDTPAENT